VCVGRCWVGTGKCTDGVYISNIDRLSVHKGSIQTTCIPAVYMDDLYTSAIYRQSVHQWYIQMAGTLAAYADSLYASGYQLF
jgi:hypothetical protein